LRKIFLGEGGVGGRADSGRHTVGMHAGQHTQAAQSSLDLTTDHARTSPTQAIGGFDDRPTYKQLDELINKARQAKLEVRFLSAACKRNARWPAMHSPAAHPPHLPPFNPHPSTPLPSNPHPSTPHPSTPLPPSTHFQIFEVAKAASSLDLEAGKSRTSGDDEEDAAAAAAAFPSREQLGAMESDPKAVRRLLVSYGLPGSGTPAKLQARAMAIVEALEGGASFEGALAVAKRLR